MTETTPTAPQDALIKEARKFAGSLLDGDEAADLINRLADALTPPVTQAASAGTDESEEYAVTAAIEHAFGFPFKRKEGRPNVPSHYDCKMTARVVIKCLDAQRSRDLRPSDGWNRDMSEAPRGRKLIAGYYNRAGNWRSVMARYYLKGTLEMSDQSDSDDEWAPEGWYEEGDADAYAENLQPIEREPVAWMYLPAPPLPEAGRA